MVRRRRASSARRCGSSASASSTTSTSRRRRRRAPATRPTSSHRDREGDGQPAGGRRLFQRGRLVFNARSRSRTSSAAAMRWSPRSTRAAINRTISLAFTEPYYTVDGVRARLRDLPAATSTRHRWRCRSTRRRRSAPAVGFGVPITETDTINFGLRSSTRTRADLGQPAVVHRSTSHQFGSTTNSYRRRAAGWSRDTRDDILYPTQGAAEPRDRGRPAGAATSSTTRSNYLQQWFWPIYGRLRADAARRLRLRATAMAASRCRSSRLLRRRRGLGARLRDELARPAGHLRQRARRQAQDRRQRASCSTRPARATSRCAAASSPTPARSTSTARNLPSAEVRAQGFRFSAGVGLAWNSPVGPLKFSYAFPLNEKQAGQDPTVPVPGRDDILTMAQEKSC